MDKKAWLDWAVGIGFLTADIDEGDDSGPWIQWISSDDKWLVAVYNPEHEELTEDYRKTIQEELSIYEFMEFAIRDEIDKRNWFLEQVEFLNTVKRHKVVISDLKIKELGSAVANSRLDALMEAFRESVEVN